MCEKTKIAMFGMGGRGQSLLEYAVIPACQDMDVEVAAVYDPYEDRALEGAAIVKRLTDKEATAAKTEKEIFDDPSIKAIIISSSWESHVDLAVKAMRAGKYVAFEVGGAYSLPEAALQYLFRTLLVASGICAMILTSIWITTWIGMTPLKMRIAEIANLQSVSEYTVKESIKLARRKLDQYFKKTEW